MRAIENIEEGTVRYTYALCAPMALSETDWGNWGFFILLSCSPGLCGVGCLLRALSSSGGCILFPTGGGRRGWEEYGSQCSDLRSLDQKPTNSDWSISGLLVVPASTSPKSSK